MATGRPSLPLGSDLNLKILWSLARWVEDTQGRPALDRICADAGLDPSRFDGSTHWASLAAVEAFLRGARDLVPDDDAFVRACAHRFEEGYGPVRFMVFALSERQFFELAAKASKMMTRISRFEVLGSTRRSFHVRYHADKPESRLMCLSRHAAWAYGPTMWSMPAAQLEETACIARGDAFCEYKLEWFDRRRLLPILASAALGGGAAVTLSALHVTPTAALALPVLGALAGWVHELTRIQRVNLAFAEQQHRVLREVGLAEAEARSEISALHQRQKEWTRLVEQQMAERSVATQEVVAELEGLQRNRVTSLRGVSHDLRNPMSVVRGNAEFLRGRTREPEERDALEDLVAAVDQIDAQLQRMHETLSDERGVVGSPRRLVVDPLADVLRRRLRALVYGRDVKITVFKTRESPEELEVDPLVFDRITDNLLTNAAKYTARGSILLEISGTPPLPGDSNQEGYLTLKLSDTGQGIEPADAERIFRPRPASERSSRASWGVGLSSAVQLLAQIGGRLDVMSKPGVGTTFWAHFPVRRATEQRPTQDLDLESMILRTVTIRRAEGA